MSTKIYEAYRLKSPGKLWSFVADAQAKAEQNIKKNLRDLLERMGNVPQNRLKMRTWKGNATGPLLYFDVARLVTEQYHKAHLGHEMDTMDLDVSISFWRHGDTVALIPYSDQISPMRDVLKFLAKHPDLEDYAYWDNVDPDANVSTQAWSARARFWDYICDHWSNRLSLELMTPGSHHIVDVALKMRYLPDTMVAVKVRCPNCGHIENAMPTDLQNPTLALRDPAEVCPACFSYKDDIRFQMEPFELAYLTEEEHT